MVKAKEIPAYDPTSLGSLLRDRGLVSDAQLSQALQFQVENADLLLGEVLIRLGIISREVLEATLTEQDLRRNGPRKASNGQVRRVLQMVTQQTIATGVAGAGMAEALQQLVAKMVK